MARGREIGVIANQSPGSEERLTRWGLIPFISVCVASAEVGLEKPDPAIFDLALRHAGCAASEPVMIGDRLDNDIRPARLRVTEGKCWRFYALVDRLQAALRLAPLIVSYD